MQIVLAIATMAVILLHEHLVIIWVVLGAATAAVCAGPAILSYIRSPAKKAQRDGSVQHQGSDAAEVTHHSMAHDGAAVHRDSVYDRPSHGGHHMV